MRHQDYTCHFKSAVVWKMWLGTMYCSCGETQGDSGNCILPSISVTPIRVNLYVL